MRNRVVIWKDPLTSLVAFEEMMLYGQACWYCWLELFQWSFFGNSSLVDKAY